MILKDVLPSAAVGNDRERAVSDRRPLWELSAGTRGELIGFDEGLAPRFRARLVELGFRPGVEVECLLTPVFGAPRVYRIGGAVFSLEDRVAAAVIVRTPDPLPLVTDLLPA